MLTGKGNTLRLAKFNYFTGILHLMASIFTISLLLSIFKTI